MPVRTVIRAGFDYLKTNGHHITGYVILPNHLHVLIGFKALTQSINTVVSNGKRFIAYEIVKRLDEQNNSAILKNLNDVVTDSDRKRSTFPWPASWGLCCR